MFTQQSSDQTAELVQTRQFERPASRHDDFAGDTTSAGSVTGEAAFRGELEDSGDRDWFQV